METYIIPSTGFSSGVNRTKDHDDIKLEKVMSEVILKAVDDGCDSEEIKRRMLEARDNYHRATDVPL